MSTHRGQAAWSAAYPCQAQLFQSCEPAGDHLALYLRAEQPDVLTRLSLKDVVTGLDAIAPVGTLNALGGGPMRDQASPPSTQAAPADGMVLLPSTLDAVIRALASALISGGVLSAPSADATSYKPLLDLEETAELCTRA